MSVEIAKCAWCGKEPSVFKDEEGLTEAVLVQCETELCFNMFSDLWLVDGWNQHQARILAARRKDFNEARMAFRTAGAFEEVPGLLLDLPGDNLWYWKDFDDYIKGSSERED